MGLLKIVLTSGILVSLTLIGVTADKDGPSVSLTTSLNELLFIDL